MPFRRLAWAREATRDHRRLRPVMSRESRYEWIDEWIQPGQADTIRSHEGLRLGLLSRAPIASRSFGF